MAPPRKNITGLDGRSWNATMEAQLQQLVARKAAFTGQVREKLSILFRGDPRDETNAENIEWMIDQLVENAAEVAAILGVMPEPKTRKPKETPHD